jgi:hypothetical protein
MTNLEMAHGFDLAGILASNASGLETKEMSAWTLVRLDKLSKLAIGIRAEGEEVTKIDDSQTAKDEFWQAEYIGNFVPISSNLIENVSDRLIDVVSKNGEDEVKTKISTSFILGTLSNCGIII